MSWIRERASWAVLAALLAALGIAALAEGRSGWPFLIGDEATYAMAAKSVASDFDLTFEAKDFARYQEIWGGRPDLILLSADEGSTISFGKPFFYPVYLAPFVAIAPYRGGALANLLLLTVACVASARVLERRWPGVGAFVVALFVFGSIAFAHTFWLHPDLPLMCLVAIALAIVCGSRRSDTGENEWSGSRVPDSLRFAAAGALLGIVASTRLHYLVALAPALVMIDGRSRRRSQLQFLGGAAAALLLTVAVQWATTGAFTAYGAERRSFGDATGYPYVDFAATEWPRHVERFGNVSWIRPGALTPTTDFPLLAANALYSLIGRNVGILPYFLPIVVPLLLSRGISRRMVLLAFVVALLGFFLLRPFNFYGGAGSLANRYFLPLYPLVWFLPMKRPHPALLAATMAGAAIFLTPVWARPAGFPLAHVDNRTQAAYRYAGSLGYGWLPHETSQKHIRALGSEDIVHNGLWTRFLDGTLHPDLETRQIIVEPGGGELLVGTGARMTGVTVHSGARDGGIRATFRRNLTEVESGTSGELELGRPSALHTMWWREGSIYLYRIHFEPLEDGPSSRLRLNPLFESPAPEPPG